LRQSIDRVEELDKVKVSERENTTLKALINGIRDHNSRPSPYAYEEDFVFAP
jgi:hypothetical protein